MTPEKDQRRAVKRRNALIKARHLPDKATDIVAREFGVCRRTILYFVSRKK